MRYTGQQIGYMGTPEGAESLHGIMREQDSAETTAEKIALQRELISTAEELLKMEESGQTPSQADMARFKESLGAVAKKAGVKLPNQASSLAGIIMHYSMYDNVFEGIFKAAVAGYKLVAKSGAGEEESASEKANRMEKFREAINEAWHELAELEAKERVENKDKSVSSEAEKIKNKALDFYEKRLLGQQEVVAEIFQNEPEAINSMLSMARNPEGVTPDGIKDLFPNKEIPPELLLTFVDSLKQLQPILRFDSAKHSLRKILDDKLDLKVRMRQVRLGLEENRGWFYETEEGKKEFVKIKEQIELENDQSTK